MSRPRLGVNIDHIATLRQARGETYPSLVHGAGLCLENGADQITIHLREDRRHIQDTDIEAIHLVTKRFGKPINLEMGTNKEILDIAIAANPDWVCLVPENRLERTTEGGLNLLDDEVFKKVQQVSEVLRKHSSKTKVSLFLESDSRVISKALLLKDLVDAVEIHTGHFARDHFNGNQTEKYLDEYKKAHALLLGSNLGTHAGHGLTLESVRPLLELGIFIEFNIGHWIICQSIFEGLGPVVSQFNTLFKQFDY